MDNNVEISVIVPIYKVEDYISQTIQSVIDQSYKNFEVILVDDGSPDKAPEIAENLLKSAGIPHKLIRQQNAGVGPARNAGIKNATGKWIYFLDADDVIPPYGLEKLLDCSNNGYDMVFCDFTEFTEQPVFEDDSLSAKTIEYTGKQLQNLFLTRKKVVLAPATLYKTSLLLDNELYFQPVPWSEDQHFMWRVLGLVNNVGYISMPLYLYRQRAGSIMRATPPEKIIESYGFITKLPSLYTQNKKVKKYLLARWVMGTLNSSAKFLPYQDWLSLFKQLKAKKHLRRLLTFNSFKVITLSVIGLISKKQYYKLASKKS